MAMIVLTLHLIVCICLIGLVLLQRSEGGALGMGGGGGGALMSGRGAADALAKMTTFAGGFFLVTSLTLTVLSGATQSSANRSIFDSLPARPAVSAPATQLPAPAEQPATTPDPTEGEAIQAAPETQQAAAQPPARSSPISLGPASAAASTRAGPVQPNRTATVVPPPSTTRGGATTQQTSAPATIQPRTTAPAGGIVTTNPRPAPTQAPALVLPNTSGSGASLSDSGPVPQIDPESDQAVAPVRRERAGPDQ